MATLTDPVTTALYSWETQKLGDWIDDLHEKLFDDESGAAPAAGASVQPTGTPTAGGQGGKGSGGQSPNGQNPGGQPKGGGRPQ